MTLRPPEVELLPPQPKTPLARVAPNPELLVESFLSGRNPRTLRAYREDLEDFRTFLGAQSSQEAAAHLLSHDPGGANALVLAYRSHLLERKLSPATVNRRLSALRALVKLARMLGLSTFVLEVENLPVEHYRDTRGPGRDGVQALLAELDARSDAKGVRDRALIRLLYDLALRRLEVVSLATEHVDLRQGAVWVQGKGRQSRQRLTLAPKTKDAVAAWMRVRKKLLGQEEGPLFVSLDSAAFGGPLSSSGLYRVIRELGDKVGLRARPHGLRHAAITEALDATRGDVRAVQRFSRHKSLNVLCVYDDARQDIAGEVSRLVAKRT